MDLETDDAGGPAPPTAGADAGAHPVVRLFAEHHLELVRLALVMTGDLASAEDVVQDAFERLHRGWREVLVLRYYCDLSVGQTAQTLGIGPSSPGMPWQLSWADGGRLLGFYWESDGKQGLLRSGLRLLDTRVPGRRLLAARQVPARTFTSSAVVTPDGRLVLAAVNFPHHPPLHRSTVDAGIAEMSPRTGKVLRVVATQTAVPWGGPGGGYASGSCAILASAPAGGEHLLVTCGGFGRVDNGRFTPLPGAPPDAAAW